MGLIVKSDESRPIEAGEQLRLVLRVAASAMGACASVILENRDEGLSVLAQYGLTSPETLLSAELTPIVKRLTKADRRHRDMHSIGGLTGRLRFCAFAPMIDDGGPSKLLAVLSEAPIEAADRGRVDLLRDLADLASPHVPSGLRAVQWSSPTGHALTDALEALPEAVAIFDREDRFLFWNSHFDRIYALQGIVIRPGLRFEDHLRACLDKSHVVAARGREEEWLAERLARFQACDGAHEHQLGSGRWVRVQDRVLPNGGKIGIRTDITELVAREQSIRLLFEANPVPMLVVDRDSLRILSVNAAAIHFYGYSEADFLKLSLPQIRPESTPGEIRDQIERLTDPAFPSIPRMHVTATGEQRVVKVRACSLIFRGQQAILAAIFDMTDQHRWEVEVRQARTFLTNVVDNIPTSVFVKDMWNGGRYVLYNRAGEILIGRSRAEIIGHTADDLFDLETAKRFIEQDTAALRLDARGLVDEQRVRDTDGKERWIRTRKVALADHDGKPRYVLGISEDVTEQRASEARIAHMAHHDALTDLPNRFLLHDRLEAALSRMHGSSEMLAVLCIDLDGFKAINDASGHATGDQLLRIVASRMRELIRPSDTVSRLGGDEFVILQTPISQMGEAALLAARLIANISRPYEIDGDEVFVSASIGIAIAPTDGRSGSTLLERADSALYAAKRNGRNRFGFADANFERPGKQPDAAALSA